MRIFYHPGHVRHDPAGTSGADPAPREVSLRAILIHEALQAAGLDSIHTPADFGLGPIEAVHAAGLLNLLRTAYGRMAAEHGGPQPAIPNNFAVGSSPRRMPRSIYAQLGAYCADNGTPILEHTWEAAYWSAQTALAAAADVAGGARAAYALCRPPGHHAGADLYGGFCYLNNAAIAAEWLTRRGRRVAILDVDYHHGQGTQGIFYQRPDVLFCSLHADPDYAYPYYWGFADERGLGPGAGYNHNYPLPPGTDETAYLSALGDALGQVRRFAPDTIVISLGVDTAEGDPIADFRLSTDAFGSIGDRVARMAVPAVVVQEGGYRLDTLGPNVVSFLRCLLEG